MVRALSYLRDRPDATRKEIAAALDVSMHIAGHAVLAFRKLPPGAELRSAPDSDLYIPPARFDRLAQEPASALALIDPELLAFARERGVLR